MDQRALQQYLAEAERHIARGVIHLARQRELIAELDLAGHDTEEARAILATLMETQVLHEKDRELLLGFASKREDRAMAERQKIYRPASARQEDAQRWSRLWEMEKRAIELLRHPAPDTFLGRQPSVSTLLPREGGPTS